MRAPTPIPARTTALVIDDEAPIRRLLRRMLESAECEVLEAEDAETGLGLIQRGTPAVDIVLTDWVMPGLDGHDVVEVLDRYRPGLPVVVVSGYTRTIHPLSQDASGPRIVQKPFTAQEVQSVVGQLVTSARRMRDAAREMARWAVEVREAGAALHEQNRRLREQADLVAAAWAMHHARSRGERLPE